MSEATAAAYDEVIYPGNPIVESHPDRLAAIATLFGMTPAPPSRCRVLEVGCGIGGNLMAMAYRRPHSEFVGIDLSRRNIEIGAGNLAEAGLDNVKLVQLDLTTLDPDIGAFDYIVAHGVYSWVPDAVRQALLALYKRHLARQGVGYISYNAYPGSHLRNVARDLMRFHVRGVGAPREKTQAAAAIVRFAAERGPADGIHGRILREQFERIDRMASEVLYHDDLEPAATPFLLHQVTEAAARHGLQYLGDTHLGAGQTFALPEAAKRLVEQIPKERVVEREQYIDFVTGRIFRRTLLCHDDVALDRNVGPRDLQGLFLAGRRSRPEEVLGTPGGGEAAPHTGEQEPQAEHPIGAIALSCLDEAWPQCVAFQELFEASFRRLANAGAAEEHDRTACREALAAFAFDRYAAQRLELHAEPLPLTTAVSDRPEASLLARKQIEASPVVMNMRHARVVLEDPVARTFLALVDGTRTIDDLARVLDGETSSGDVGMSATRVTREQVQKNLRALARLALLVR